MIHYDIKFTGLGRLYAAHRNEFLDATDKALSSGIAVGGPNVDEFENNLARISQRKYAVAVGSCTDALFFILKACGIGEGDEVITTSYSFIATASAILRAGARPVFVDVDEHYHLDLAKVQNAISPRSRAVLVVNLFGDCVNFDAFERYCRNQNLLLIEDAAQSFGARFDSKPSGKLGIASAFSFSPMKTLPSFGTAGAIVTDNEGIATICKSLRQHGKGKDRPESVMLGYNSLLPADKAAQMNVALRYIDECKTRRGEIAAKYISALSSVNGILTPKTRQNAEHSWHKFVIRINRRDELQKYLFSRGIQTLVHYKLPLPFEPIFACINPHAFLKASEYSKTCLSLPIYAELENMEVDCIIEQVLGFR